MKARLLHINPLYTVPGWANHPSPEQRDIEWLRSQIVELHQQIAAIQMSLASIPAPAKEALTQLPTALLCMDLCELISVLRALRYPAHLTAWMDDVRRSAVSIRDQFSNVVADLQRLYHLRPTTRAYRDCLHMTLQRTIKVVDDLKLLQYLLDDYLALQEDGGYRDIGVAQAR